MKSDIKVELAREIACEVAFVAPDVGVRAGRDPFHSIYRSRQIVSFTSWDMLGVQQHRETQIVAVRAIEEFGTASSNGRYSGGLTSAHTACEGRIARFFAGEAATLFSAKTQAVLSIVTSLCSEGSVVLGTALSSLPLADACSLVGADFFEFEGDAELRVLLERHKLAKRVLVVCEAVSSVTGQAIDVAQTFSTVEQSQAWLVIDETAALGHTGLRGAGSAEAVPNSPALLARIVGLGALCGGELAALVGPHELRELLSLRSRYIRFDPAPTPVVAAAVHRALDLVEIAITHRKRLLMRAKVAHAALKAQGWKLVSSEETPILSLWFDSLLKAREIQDALLQRSILVDALPARSFRKNGGVVRIILSKAHSDVEVEKLLEGLLEVRKRIIGKGDDIL